VILLILFTLALSIVLRPRHRTPIELSWSEPCPAVLTTAVPSTQTPSSSVPSITESPIESSRC
jgi:hypothetical protein